jgi:hypothetical protein
MGAGGRQPEVLRLREGLPWREVDGAVVVLDLESSSYFAVNRTGSALWQHLQEGSTVEQMTAALAGVEDLDAERARADVEAFVADLRAKALLAP